MGSSRLPIEASMVSQFSQISVEECSEEEMEWHATLSSFLPGSTGDDQSKHQAPLGIGRKEEDASLLKDLYVGHSGMEDGKSTNVPPILANSGSCSLVHDDDVDSKEWEGFDFEDIRIFEETTKRLAEHMKKAPKRTVNLIEAANHLGVSLDYILRAKHFLKEGCDAIIEVGHNKVQWVHGYGYTVEEETRRIRNSMIRRSRFEARVKFMSNEKNAKKFKWRWLFLSEADINNFVTFQNEILMMVYCPSDINLEVSRPAQDKQRRYGIIGKRLRSQEIIGYFVSKLESHDVVNLDEISFTSGSSEEADLIPVEEVWKGNNRWWFDVNDEF